MTCPADGAHAVIPEDEGRDRDDDSGCEAGRARPATGDDRGRRGGEQEGFGFVVRAIGYGGLDFEDDRPETLAEAIHVLEEGLAPWFEEQGVELE